jgi:ATP-dependent Clp protease ATP-binding subunit ClpC
MQARDISLAVDKKVIDLLASEGFDPVYGARPLRREVERQVENPLAMKIVRGECPDGSKVAIRVKDKAITFDIT